MSNELLEHWYVFFLLLSESAFIFVLMTIVTGIDGKNIISGLSPEQELNKNLPIVTSSPVIIKNYHILV